MLATLQVDIPSPKSHILVTLFEGGVSGGVYFNFDLRFMFSSYLFLTFFYFLLSGALAVVKFDYRDNKFFLPWPKAVEQGRQYWRIRDIIKPDISLSSLKLCVRFMGSSSYGTARRTRADQKVAGLNPVGCWAFFYFHLLGSITKQVFSGNPKLIFPLKRLSTMACSEAGLLRRNEAI